MVLYEGSLSLGQKIIPSLSRLPPLSILHGPNPIRVIPAVGGLFIPLPPAEASVLEGSSSESLVQETNRNHPWGACTRNLACSGPCRQFLARTFLLETPSSGALLLYEESDLNHIGQALGKRALSGWNLSQKVLAKGQ